MKLFRHPIPAISSTKRLLVFSGGLILAVVMFYAIERLDVPLQTSAARWGMLSLEAAGTVERSTAIIESWKGLPLGNAQSIVLLDFVFALCYSTSLTIACFWAAATFRERGYRKMGWLATFVAWAQWPAAVFDYVANIALLMQLHGSIEAPWPRTTWWCEAIKFLLLAAAVGVLAAAIFVRLFRRRPVPPP